MELKLCHGNYMRTARSLRDLGLRHDSYWMSRYPCIDVKLNDDVGNYYQSVENVKNICLVKNTATANYFYYIQCI